MRQHGMLLSSRPMKGVSRWGEIVIEGAGVLARPRRLHRGEILDCLQQVGLRLSPSARTALMHGSYPAKLCCMRFRGSCSKLRREKFWGLCLDTFFEPLGIEAPISLPEALLANGEGHPPSLQSQSGASSQFFDPSAGARSARQ